MGLGIDTMMRFLLTEQLNTCAWILVFKVSIKMLNDKLKVLIEGAQLSAIFNRWIMI